MKKTEGLNYDTFDCQTYLTEMTPLDAEVIFRARLRSINCKGNMSSSYRTNMSCRLCGTADETQEHLVDCVKVRNEEDHLDLSIVNDLASADPSDVKELCYRVRTFNELIKEAS